MFFEKMEKFQLVWLAIILAFGLVLAVKTATGTLSNDKITVTGSAYKIVKSDSARMEFEITNRSANRQTAYNKVKAQLPIVKQYLQDKGITDIDVSASNGYNSYKYLPNGTMTNDVAYYNLSQPIVIKSNDVQKIKEVSTDIQSLLDKGIDINVTSTQYFYSKLADLKVDLLKDATTDAKTGTMTYDAAKAGNSGTDAEVELSVGKVIAGTTDTSIFSNTATVATDGNRVTITDRDGFSMSFLAKEGKTGKTVFDVTDIGNMTLHIGANEHQNMDVRIQEISCETLYIDDLDVTTVTGADRAISALDDAIAMVSDARSKIGAYENRLEYATSSLDTFEENMTDAMSRLTDVDMAEEMTNYTQYNVLQQAGVSVLSQANDLPQNVLSLLQ